MKKYIVKKSVHWLKEGDVVEIEPNPKREGDYLIKCERGSFYRDTILGPYSLLSDYFRKPEEGVVS